jgi:hypothetical protein
MKAARREQNSPQWTVKRRNLKVRFNADRFPVTASGLSGQGYMRRFFPIALALLICLTAQACAESDLSSEQRFLRRYLPVETPGGQLAPKLPQPVGISQTGDVIAYRSSTDFLNGEDFNAFVFAKSPFGALSQERAMPPGFGGAFVTPRGDLVGSRFRICSAKLPFRGYAPAGNPIPCPVQERAQISVLSPNGASKLIDIPAPILSADRQWVVGIRDISSNGRWAWLSASGMNTHKINPRDSISVHLLVDLDSGTLAQAAPMEDTLSDTLYNPYSARVAEDANGIPVIVTIGSEQGVKPSVRLLSLSPWSVREMPSPTKVGDRWFSNEGRRWLQEGFAQADIFPSLRKCEGPSTRPLCIHLAWTPDRRNVVYQRESELVLIRSDGNEIIGTLPLAWPPNVKFSGDGSLLAISQNGAVKWYRYRSRN